jgi:hypothetical protein
MHYNAFDLTHRAEIACRAYETAAAALAARTDEFHPAPASIPHG